MATPSPTPVPTKRFLLTSSDGLCIACARWDSRGPARAVVQIAPGMGEHMGRHAGTLDALVAAGLTVYANVGQQLRGLHTLIGRYRDAGLRDIAFDFCPGGRHEMLNDINQRQVQTRLLGWISRTLAKLNGDDRSVTIALELQH
jgi:alpha-beta hydrolase superfamily lysophospholipase